MNTLFIDILVLGLVALLLFRISIYKPLKSYNKEYLSLQSGTMMKGFFALVVMYHHLAQKTTEGILMRPFSLVGYLAVAVFFFFSGYGLQKKYISDESYCHQFLLRRLPALLIPYIIMNFVYWLWNAVDGNLYSFKDILLKFVNGDPLVTGSWYIICVLLFYVVFYILMRICKRNFVWMIAGACLYNIIWIVICFSFSYGAWWYRTSHLLIVGMIWATWENEISKFLQKYYIFFISAAGAAFILLNIINSHQSGIINGGISMIIAVNFVIIVNLITMKFCIGNGILKYLGTISLEIYMIHNLLIQVMERYISNEFVLCACVIICSIISAHIFHIVFSFLLSKYKAILNRSKKNNTH